MIDNGYLSEYQHDFVQGHLGRLYTTQLLKVMDLWIYIIDKDGTVDAIYIWQYAKAFDKAPHQRLLIKLEGYGVKEKLLEWFRDFQIGRRQRLEVAGSFFEWTQVLSGIPQGSVLRPVLLQIQMQHFYCIL